MTPHEIALIGTHTATARDFRDTTTGPGSCPTVGNICDKLIPEGIHGCFARTCAIPAPI